MEDYALTVMHTLDTLDNSTPASPARREGRSVSRLSGTFVAVSKSRGGASRYRGTPLICQVAGCSRRRALSLCMHACGSLFDVTLSSTSLRLRE